MRDYLNLRTTIALGLIFAFLVNIFGPLPIAQADEFLLPKPGVMVSLSPAFNPAVLKGIKLDPRNPFKFHFYVDSGDNNLSQEELRNESATLIKYFLASLTIPEKDLWVNLSPYEKDRIVPEEFGQTEMGRDLLAEDYILKQITASLIYPESHLGKEFWQEVYTKAQAEYGTTNIPINTFNKVWIIPQKAVVYENGGVAFVLENHLKVMLQQDYLSLEKHVPVSMKSSDTDSVNSLGNQIVREIVIPALTKEVNEGKNFAPLRQVFYSLILATWYKKKIKDSILNKVYSNQNKIDGVSVSAQDKQEIYQEYLRAFKKGVYNYIKEEPDPLTNQTIPRKYFSGGVQASQQGRVTSFIGSIDDTQLTNLINNKHLVDETTELRFDGAMNSQLPASARVADRAMTRVYDMEGQREERSLIAMRSIRHDGWNDLLNVTWSYSIGVGLILEEQEDRFLEIIRDINEIISERVHDQENREAFLESLKSLRNLIVQSYDRLPKVIPPEKQAEYDQTIKDYPQLMSTIDDMVSFIEGDIQGRLQDVQINQSFIKEALESRGEDAAHIENHSITGGDVVFKADRRKIMNVLRTLLTNTVQIAARRSIQPELNLLVTHKDGDTIIEYSDNAGGFQGERAERFLQKLHKDQPDREEAFFLNESDRQGGTGLGLAQAYHIVELHGGTIHVENTTNEYGESGAKFVITLPDDWAMKADKAVITNLIKPEGFTRGGIDFNPAQMSMQIKNQGDDFKFDFNGTQMDAAQVTGASFTIRQIIPVTNLPLILGSGLASVEVPQQYKMP